MKLMWLQQCLCSRVVRGCGNGVGNTTPPLPPFPLTYCTRWEGCGDLNPPPPIHIWGGGRFVPATHLGGGGPGEAEHLRAVHP